jgi:hypothetical protein
MKKADREFSVCLFPFFKFGCSWLPALGAEGGYAGTEDADGVV